MPSLPEYDQLDGIGLAQWIRSGQVSRAEVLAACQERIALANPALNAIAGLLPDVASQQLQLPLADGPLAGVPILLKDLLADVAGYPTSCGSHLFATQPVKADAELVRRYRNAGLVLAGKTTTPEFALLPYTESSLFGATRNPWDVNRTPGGSSGGAGAAVASGMVPIAHAGDGGGSIRIPASNCGLFGLKPSRGRTPFGPLFGEAWLGMVEQHAVTRSVRDSAAMLDIMIAGYDPCDVNYCPPPPQTFLSALNSQGPRLRIAFTDRALTGGPLDPDCKAALMHSVKLLQQLGHHVEQAHPPLDAPEHMQRAMMLVLAGEIAVMMRKYKQEHGREANWRDIEIETLVTGVYGEMVSAGEYAWVRDLMLRQARLMASFHQKWDLLLTPTMNQPPAIIGSLMIDRAQAAMSRFFIGMLGWSWTLKTNSLVADQSRRIMEYMGWTIPFNLSGQPAMSVPLYWNAQNLPIGTQLVAPYGAEQTLFNLALELEQAQPWAQRRPPAAAGTV